MDDSHPHSILIVEDERIVARDIQQTLHELGYDAFAIASSAEEAIAKASERCPDLVLMDIRIKGERDGIETAKLFKTRFGIPVVYLTAHADDRTIERAKTTEPHGYLIKPVKAAELRSVVEVSLYKHAMEKRLREQERWFATTLRSIADAVITVDLAGNVTFMNPAAEALTGAVAADSLGKPARDIVRLVTPEELPTTRETPLATALREQCSVALEEGELQNIATGAVRMISDSAAPVVDDRGTLGAVMVFRDVTERKQLQNQLEVADRLASLGTMAAGVAHEVNNPLAVVVANASYIAEELARHRAALEQAGGPATLGQRLDSIGEALGDLQSAATRIARIVSDLRSFSRPVPSRATVAEVARCIEWAVRTTAHEFRHRARVMMRLGEVPPVRADETRLGQVLINLLVNAAHAITPGNADGNEVSIGSSMRQDGWVAIEVTDTGGGIPKEHLARIFDPFFTTKPVGLGTGLGLSICHGIVASLGGQLHIDSEVGKGTRCLLLLPPAPAAEGEVQSVAPPPNVSPRRRILVVDDEELVLRALDRVLQEHELVCTQSTAEALALVERGESFDLVLADVMMPNRTGVEFYEAILARTPELARRVVFLCGGATTPELEAFLRSVPNRRIDKPFDIATLREAVQQLLPAVESPSAPSATKIGHGLKPR